MIHPAMLLNDIPSGQAPSFLPAKDHIARRIITGPKASNYEAWVSQSGGRADRFGREVH
jgi:hypothetical protein